MSSSRSHRIFQKLLRIAPDLRRTREYAKSKVPGLMDLNLDVLERSGGYMRIALSHYWLHPSGDMIADPDMEIAVQFDSEAATALTYQDAYGYQETYPDGSNLPDMTVQARLNEFLEQWLDNLANQGHALKVVAMTPREDLWG